jgi:hypothetical protein
MQRTQATLFHHGIAGTPDKVRTRDGRAFLERLQLPADARERIQIALGMVDAIDAQMRRWSASCASSPGARPAAGR